jgi:hypothetical protein
MSSNFDPSFQLGLGEGDFDFDWESLGPIYDIGQFNDFGNFALDDLAFAGISDNTQLASSIAFETTTTTNFAFTTENGFELTANVAAPNQKTTSNPFISENIDETPTNEFTRFENFITPSDSTLIYQETLSEPAVPQTVSQFSETIHGITKN